MISDGLARFRRGLILGSALALGVGLASWQPSALAGVSEQGQAKSVPSLAIDAWASGAIVIAEKDHDGNDNGDDNDKGHRKGKNANRDKDDDNGHRDGGGNNGHRNGGNNGNWNNNGNGGKYGEKGHHDGDGDNGHWNGGNNGNWNKYGDKGNHNGDGDWDKNGYQHWSQNHKNHGKGWSGYNNNWNKNWDRRAYVRDWNRQPYYGEFIGGVVLGSILAANGIGIVPYAPEPYLCWYWADPYMIRGYWDYCY
jgi:hypothetical protein